MTEERLNDIRKFFWNYKYLENYDERIYEMVCELIAHIDASKERA